MTALHPAPQPSLKATLERELGLLELAQPHDTDIDPFTEEMKIVTRWRPRDAAVRDHLRHALALMS